jgi:flagellar hook-associated protein 1 FlgK
MGLTNILNTATRGLSVTQAGLQVVSTNVANADSVGYVRRQFVSVEEVAGGPSSGVRGAQIQRMLDKIVQRQFWMETSGAAYTQTRADALTALDQLYGAPGAPGSLDTSFNGFTTALTQLKNEPSNYATRRVVIDRAADLATRLNDLSDGVQALRQQAEDGIDSAISRVNGLLQELQVTNARLAQSPSDNPAAALADDRDRIVTELARYLDIKTDIDANNRISVVTTSGVQLFDGVRGFTFGFDKRQITSAEATYSTNPADRGVGTITLTTAGGVTMDALQNRLFRSGEIAALVELRDTTLVQVQTQLDELAGQMASALSDVENSTPVVGPPSGFDTDMAGMLSGNRIQLDYTIQPAGTKRSFTFVRVDNPAALPLPAAAGGDANNPLIGIDFTGGPASVAAQIQAAVGGTFTVTNAGSTLRIVGSATRNVDALTARATNPNLTNGGPNAPAELPLFTDQSGAIYTGSWDDGGQRVGFAQRIAVNPSLIADQSRLVVFQTGPQTLQGDTTRPAKLLDRLTNATRAFTPATGIGGTSQAYNGSITDFARRAFEFVGQSAENATRLNEGQMAAHKAVEARFAETSGVSVDREMTMLIELQTAYAANARIITAAKEMMDLLLRA